MHRIRLQRPWECDHTTRGATWRRRFGRPTGLQPGDTLWLVCAGFAGSWRVELNGMELGILTGETPFPLEVTGLIGLRNELCLAAIGEPPQPPSSPAAARAADAPPGQVVLEIRNENRVDQNSGGS